MLEAALQRFTLAQEELGTQFRKEIWSGWQFWGHTGDIDSVPKRKKGKASAAAEHVTRSETLHQALVNKDIDNIVRRRKGKPGHEDQSLAETEASLQVFGTYADIDAMQKRRRVPEGTHEIARGDRSDRGMQVSNLTNVVRRKHFIAESTERAIAGGLETERDVCNSLETVTIESQYSKRRLSDCLPNRSGSWNAASSGALPAGRCWDESVANGSPRRLFFDCTVHAQRYAEILGRPMDPKPKVEPKAKPIVKEPQFEGLPRHVRKVLVSILPNDSSPHWTPKQTLTIRKQVEAAVRIQLAASYNPPSSSMKMKVPSSPSSLSTASTECTKSRFRIKESVTPRSETPTEGSSADSCLAL